MSYEVLVNATGYLSIMQYSNNIVGGLYGLAILFSIFAIVLFAGLNFKFQYALQGALFVSTISALFLSALELLPIYYFYAFGVAFLLCFIAIIISER